MASALETLRFETENAHSTGISIVGAGSRFVWSSGARDAADDYGQSGNG